MARLTFMYPGGSLSGSRKDPACVPGTRWSLDGMFSGKQFNATAYVAPPDGGPATTVVSLAKT